MRDSSSEAKGSTAKGSGRRPAAIAAWGWVLGWIDQIRPGIGEIVVGCLLASLLAAVPVVMLRLIGVPWGSFNAVVFITLFFIFFVAILAALARRRQSQPALVRFSWRTTVGAFVAFFGLSLVGAVIIWLGGRLTGEDVGRMYVPHALIKYGISLFIGLLVGLMSRGNAVLEAAVAGSVYALLDGFFLIVSLWERGAAVGGSGAVQVALIVSVCGVAVLGSLGAALGTRIKARILAPHEDAKKPASGKGHRTQ